MSRPWFSMVCFLWDWVVWASGQVERRYLLLPLYYFIITIIIIKKKKEEKRPAIVAKLKQMRVPFILHK
jgi:hypothetical protein